MTLTYQPRLHALVPAAGRGTRLSAEMPKQYVRLRDRPMLAHTIDALLAEARVTTVFIVLAPDDEDFVASGCASRFAPDSGRWRALHCGGSTRALSVHNGLQAIAAEVDARDWVLVHDAARPCLPLSALGRLIDTLAADPVGGLLALPIGDTLKRADSEGLVLDTPSRDGLWAAQTPQMFRHGALLAA
ncbi:MAG: 2-C-methyl-D-erythritol 4-phosphate cytidylyltransferase, partial [Proteobacteria bacterium]|nr:2-C-methyl-D-erythritol 4-phosphate cytidylyltransferase [Burkholderiales bacterium]